MPSDKYVEICATIRKSIEIIKSSYTGKEYGVILVEEDIILTPLFPRSKKLFPQSFWFYVFIWNQDLLNQYVNALKPGVKVLVKGTVEVIGSPGSAYDEHEGMAWFSKFVINVRDESSLMIIAKDEEDNVTLN